MTRSSASRSVWRARRGRCSLTRTPGVRVAMAANSPRYSAGASGLGSQVSCWAGPPHMNRTMQALALPPVGAVARPRSSCGRPRPKGQAVGCMTKHLRSERHRPVEYVPQEEEARRGPVIDEEGELVQQAAVLELE